MVISIMQQNAQERQQREEAEYRNELLQRDMNLQLYKMKAEQELAAERAQNRILRDAQQKAMLDGFFQK